MGSLITNENFKDLYRVFCSVIAGNPDLNLTQKACEEIYKPLFGAGGITYPVMEHGFRHMRRAAEVLLRMRERGEQTESVDVLDPDQMTTELVRLRALGFAGPEIRMKWAVAAIRPQGTTTTTTGAAAAPASSAPAPRTNRPALPADNQVSAVAAPPAPRPGGHSASGVSGGARASRKRKRIQYDVDDDEDADLDPTYVPERKSSRILLHTGTRQQANRPLYLDTAADNDEDEDGDVEVDGEVQEQQGDEPAVKAAEGGEEEQVDKEKGTVGEHGDIGKKERL